jgi:hypothetical protein
VSTTIECRARQHSEMWVASIPQHRVYGCGRTLRALHDNLIHGLALIGVTAHVTITPVSPELDRLRRAEAAYETALTEAVTTLATHGSTVRDAAEATGVPIARVTALQARPPTPRTRTSRKPKA